MKHLTDSELYLLACLDQFKGKIDWHQVASDLSIVSWDAARKRLEALRKARTAMQPSTPPEKESAPTTPTKKNRKDVLSASPRASKVVKRESPRKGRKSVKYEEDEYEKIISDAALEKLTSGSDFEPSD